MLYCHQKGGYPVSAKRPTNENIHIGEIYVTQTSIYDRDGDSGGHFYQVVGLRAKTLVELQSIRRECFVDENCDLGRGMVRVRPLPGQFQEGSEPFIVRADGICEWDGKKRLRKPEHYFPTIYYEVREGGTWTLMWLAGFRELDRLQKEGKLPPWANKEK